MTALPHAAAVFSPCRRYRYTLMRQWGEGGIVTFCMLNPSTADERTNDPTVERCQRRAKKLGFGALVVVNLFALRATDPQALYGENVEPIGRDNDFAIITACKSSKLVICGWGKHGTLLMRGVIVLDLMRRADIKPHALKINNDGSPQHPLYVSYAVEPRPFY